MTARSTRDGRRHSRFLRGTAEGFEICTVNHAKEGALYYRGIAVTFESCTELRGVTRLSGVTRLNGVTRLSGMHPRVALLMRVSAGRRAGELRLDCTVTYGDDNTESIVMAHPHEDYDHYLWFQAYTPREEDGCYIECADGTLNEDEARRSDDDETMMRR